MSKRFIVKNKKGLYQTPRRNNGKMYESRTQWSKSLDDARIFSTRGAAKNSANQAKCKDPEILEVSLLIIQPNKPDTGGVDD